MASPDLLQDGHLQPCVSYKKLSGFKLIIKQLSFFLFGYDKGVWEEAFVLWAYFIATSWASRIFTSYLRVRFTGGCFWLEYNMYPCTVSNIKGSWMMPGHLSQIPLVSLPWKLFPCFWIVLEEIFSILIQWYWRAIFGCMLVPKESLVTLGDSPFRTEVPLMVWQPTTEQSLPSLWQTW